MRISSTLALGFGVMQLACSTPSKPAPANATPANSALSVTETAPAQGPLPWQNKQLSPDERAELLLNAVASRDAQAVQSAAAELSETNWVERWKD